MKIYDDIINSASKQYGIPVNTIKAVISVESNWKPDATRAEPRINDTSYGLMQVLVKTGRWVTNNPKLTPNELMNPTLNILVGVRYLAYLKKKYKTIDKMLASYNAGKPYMSKKDPTKFTNQRYVDKVRKAIRGYDGGKAPVLLVGATVLIIGAVVLGK